MSKVDEVLDFWFGRGDEANHGKPKEFWFTKNPEFDQEVRNRFMGLYEQTAAGELEHWKETPRGCLALILILDQFPRNMFRGDARSFATDPLALAAAKQAIEAGFDQQLPRIQRWFIYLPLEHSEDLTDQRQSVELFRKLAGEDQNNAETLRYAIRHMEIIERFGRFPHRNETLGRISTEEEKEFLKQPNSSF